MTLRNASENLALDSTVQAISTNTSNASESLTLLRRIFLLLKPLGVVTGNGSNRLSVDINSSANLNVAQATASNLNCNVGTVATVNNQAQMGGVTAFDMMRALSRSAYNSGIRANIT